MRRFGICLAVAMVFGFASDAQAVFELDLSSQTGAKIRFTGTGDTFTFVDGAVAAGAPRDFVVTATAGGAGDATGLFGNISGTFTIGVITSPPGPVNGNTSPQSAPVTGSGTFSIENGAKDFSATLQFDSIQTFIVGTSTVGAIITVRLSAATYTGSNVDLGILRDGINADTDNTTVSFQFGTKKNLTTLTTNGQVNDTLSYSGTITVASVPEPATMTLVASGLPFLGIGAWYRKRRNKLKAA